MRSRVNARHTRLLAPRAREDGIEPVIFAFDDEEDAFCDPYFVASRESDIPALQEYLHELQAD